MINGFNPQPSEANWMRYEVDRASSIWKNIKPGDIVTIHTREQQEKPVGMPGYPKDNQLHVQIVVGWGPDVTNFEDWQDSYTGQLYATYADLPEGQQDNYVPYVMDRGLRLKGYGIEDYAMRGPRPFHSQYSVSYINIWVAQGSLITRQ